MIFVDTFPLISCLMVTANDRMPHVQRSVRCYLDQTYPNRELVVVNEGPKDYQRELDCWLSGLGRNDIRPVWLDGFYTLGSLRNISISMCLGSFYCQWDDDDFCTPERLAVQYCHLASTGSRACFLGDQLHYYFPTREMYWDNWARYYNGGHLMNSVIPGTAMVSREVDVRYPSTGKSACAGEDSAFAARLFDDHPDSVSILSGRGYMHVYSYHGTNQVYDQDHHRLISYHRSQPREDILRCRSHICTTIDYLGLAETKVMCKDGLVFTSTVASEPETRVRRGRP